MKFYATKGPRKILKPQRKAGFKSSKATQKKRNLQAKFEELDIARRNAAMNSSRETLLREEEEQRKRLRYPIGLESVHETSPPGKPVCPRKILSESRMTNPPVEFLSDDDASDVILLKDLKIQNLNDPKNRPEHPIHERMEIKCRNRSILMKKRRRLQ